MSQSLFNIGKGVVIVVLIISIIGKLLYPSLCIKYVVEVSNTDPLNARIAYLLVIGLEAGIASGIAIQFYNRWPYMVAGLFFVGAIGIVTYASVLSVGSSVSCSGGALGSVGPRAVVQNILLAIISFWVAYEEGRNNRDV